MASAKRKSSTTKSKQPGRTRRLARASRQRARHHYWRIMPNAKWKRVVLWSIFLLWALTSAVQLLYPADRTLPRAHLAGSSIGYATFEDTAKRVNERFADSKIRLTAGGDEFVEARLAEIGAEPQVERVALALADYPLWMRFIPFSVFVHAPAADVVSLRYTPKILQTFATDASVKLTTSPKNARLAIEQGKLVAGADSPGRTVDTKQIEQAIIQASVSLGRVQPVYVPSQTAPAQTTASDLQAVRAQATRALNRAIILNIDGASRDVPQAAVASWLEIRSEADVVTVAVSEQAFHAYMEELNKEVGKPSGTTHITIVNGIETGRTEGEAGRQIDESALRQRVSEHLLSEAVPLRSIDVAFAPTAPKVTYNSRYTSSQEGLQAYASDIAKSRGVSIVVRQLDGPGWQASADGDVSTVSASTYKLYVALMLFDRMNRGEIGWNDRILDTTVSGCFDRMTIASTNPCAETWLAQWGRTNVNNFVYAKGFSRGTTFTHPTATHTTANDLAKFMVGLENGSLVSGAQRDRLLRSLSSHPYRMGVPSGSGGRVWDKVGFLWNYVHDAAIVHHPRGRYVIVVMTGGGSYGRIATITREVEKILYP